MRSFKFVALFLCVFLKVVAYVVVTNKKQRYKACAEICLGFSVIEYQYVKETKAAEPC